MSVYSPEAEVQSMRSDLGGGDSQEASGLQLVDPSIQDANPWEIDLDQVCCKLQCKKIQLEFPPGIARIANDSSSQYTTFPAFIFFFHPEQCASSE